MNNIHTIIDLHTYLSQLLEFHRFVDIDTINGIQVTHQDMSPISKIAYAVDSSLSVIEKAVEQKANILLVHHGFYWGSVEPIVNTMYHKTKALLDANIALFACHLPLDAHMQFGNNFQLAQRIGLSEIIPFGNYKGLAIGTQGTFNKPLSYQSIQDKLFANDNYGQDNCNKNSIPIINAPTTQSFPLGMYEGSNRTAISKVAIISGDGTRELHSAHEADIDLYITGDASHTAWLKAQELDLNVLFAGHYFTEVWGVLALAHHLSQKFNIEGVFIDEPTRL